MSVKRVAVIGAGGHGTVVASTLIAAGDEVVGFYDDDEQTWGRRILDIPVVGPTTEITSETCSHAIIAVRNNEMRKHIAEHLNIEWTSVVHPFTWVHPGVPMGAGTVICAGAVVQPNTEIGSHVIVNTRASVGHDCRIANYVHVAAAAHVGGGSSVDEGALMALGSYLLPRVHLGAWARLGAGAVAARDVPPGATLMAPLPRFLDIKP